MTTFFRDVFCVMENAFGAVRTVASRNPCTNRNHVLVLPSVTPLLFSTSFCRVLHWQYRLRAGRSGLYSWPGTVIPH